MGLHIGATEGTPMSNAFVSLMQGIGHDMEGFGDSTGSLGLTIPRGVTSTGGAK